jgi:hypothetical protein
MVIDRRSFLLSLPLVARASCPTGASRLLVLIDDVSPSYRRSPAMVSQQQAIVDALGPGDAFTDVELGGAFTPARVKVQCLMPAASPELLTRVRRPRELLENQRRLNAIWKRVDALRGPVAAFVAAPRHTQGPTPLFETLTYLSNHMMRSGAVEKRLAIFSDLVHDCAGRTSAYPPAEMHPRFDGVSVFALFVPWTADFAKREAAWRGWFAGCGACGFAMLDIAQSQVTSVLPQSPVPRILRQRI